MTKDDYINFWISRVPHTKPASGRRMILTRCKECGDSRNISHAHCYISVPQKDNQPSYFYCHKCKSSGLVTQSVLAKWGLLDIEVSRYLAEHNKKYIESGGRKDYTERTVYTLYNNFISDVKKSYIKLDYINNRLGVNLTPMDCLNNKIVLNLLDLLNYNSIGQKDYTRDVNIISALDEYFMGFISADNAFVNMRKLVADGQIYESIDQRYVRYNIFGKYDNTEKFYLIPTMINPQSPERVKINIAEGEFDILSTYFNLRKDNSQVYASVGGSNYLGILSYFIRTISLPYVEIHYYVDNDEYGTDDVIHNIAEFLNPFMIPMYVHRNLKEGQKDFGVSLDKIREDTRKINNW